MDKYQKTFTNTAGDSIAGATITVYVSGTNQTVLATLFDANDTGGPQKPNPFQTATRGVISFYAADGKVDVRGQAQSGLQYIDDNVTLFDAPPRFAALDQALLIVVEKSGIAFDAANRAELAAALVMAASRIKASGAAGASDPSIPSDGTAYFYVISNTSDLFELWLKTGPGTAIDTGKRVVSATATALLQSKTAALAPAGNSAFTSVLAAVFDVQSNVLLFGVMEDGSIYSPQLAAQLDVLTANNAANTAKLAPITLAPDQFTELRGIAEYDLVTGVLLRGMTEAGVLVGSAAPVAGSATAAAIPIQLGSLNGVAQSGQSLGVGSNGRSSLTTAQPFSNKMLGGTLINPSPITAINALVEADDVGNNYGETGLAAACNAYSANHPFVRFLATIRGFGGQPISAFLPGTALYNALLNQIAANKSLSESIGEAYVHIATIMSQGENNDGNATSLAAYMADFYTFGAQHDADVRALGGNIAGGTRQIPIIIPQVSSHTITSGGHTTPMAAYAQYLLAKQYPALFTISGPGYYLPYVDGIHHNNHGYRWRGERDRRVLEKLISGEGWKFVRPISVTKYGTRGLLLRFQTPTGFPLTTDTVSVTDPNGFLGFELDDNSSPLTSTGNALAVSSVRQISDLEFLLTATASIPAGAFVSYAWKGTVGAAGGATTGARGCVRDTDPAVSYTNNAAGQPYPLFNWCAHFREPIL